MPEVEQFTNELKMRWLFDTGFGHGLIQTKSGQKISLMHGVRIQMSDRVYEIQRNGEYRRVA